MKFMKCVLSFAVCICILSTNIAVFSNTSSKKEETIKNSSDAVAALMEAAKANNGDDYNIWSDIDQSKNIWRAQYFDEINQEYVDFPQSKVGTWSDPPADDMFCFGIGSNEPVIGIQSFGKDNDSPKAMRIHITPHKPGSGYSKLALAYYAVKDGDYYIGTQKDFDVMIAMFKNNNPEYYQDYAVPTDKYGLAIYKNEEKIFPEGDEEYAYVTPDNLSLQLKEIKVSLKKGDVIRYVTDGATSPGSDPWMKAVVIHPWIYEDIPPEAKEMSIVATAGFSTAETAFDFFDESGKELTFSIVDEPKKGTVKITDTSNGIFVYTADRDNANTEDSFTYTVSNGLYTSQKAAVKVSIVDNQPAYPKNTSFSTLQGMKIENESLMIYDPDPAFVETARYDPLGYLLNQAWETAPEEVDLDNFGAAHADAPADGEWRVEYNLSGADRTWRPMEYVYKWNYGGGFLEYPGGKDVCYSTQSSIDGKQVYFVVESPLNGDGVIGTYDPTKPMGRFKLTTAIESPFNGDPQGSLLFTFKEDGTYIVKGNPYAPKVGIPDREGLRPNYNPNVRMDFWIEKNGVEIPGTRMSFTTGHLEENFPEFTVDAKAGDTLRFVAAAGDCWGGWMQQLMMSPMIVKGSSGIECTVTETTAHGELELDPSGTFSYTPDAEFSGEDSFVVNVNDGKDAVDYTVTISVLEDKNPVCDSKYAATTPGGSKEIALTGSDDHNKPLTYKIVTPPANGTATIENDKLIYQANPGFSGFDTVEIICNDGRFDSDKAFVKVLMTDKSYDAVSQFINMIQQVEECIDGDKNPSLLPDVAQAPWRVQYYYLGITGNINFETTRIYETAVSGLWLKDGDWEGYAVNDDMATCPGITIEGVNALGNENAVFISSGYKPNSQDPVGALSFLAPEEGTYLLLPDEKMPYFSPNLNTRTSLKKPIEFWIEKDGKQIWPENGETMKVGARDQDNLMPSILVSLKKGSKVRFCAKSFADDNGDTLGCIVRPIAYLAGEYDAKLDPNPDGEPEMSKPDPSDPGGGNTEDDNNNTGGNNEEDTNNSTEENNTSGNTDTEEVYDNEPVNGVYKRLDLTALKRQMTVAENGVTTIKILEAGVLTTEMIELLNENSMTLRVELCDEDANASLIWEFLDLSQQNDAVPLEMNSVSKYQDQIDTLFGKNKKQVVSFRNDTSLKGETRVTLLNQGDFKSGDKLYLYKLNRTSGELELCDAKVLLSADGKYLRFDIDSTSEYIVSDMSNMKVTKISEVDDGGLPAYAIVLIAAGSVILAAGIAVSVILIVKKKQRKTVKE